MVDSLSSCEHSTAICYMPPSWVSYWHSTVHLSIRPSVIVDRALTIRVLNFLSPHRTYGSFTMEVIMSAAFGLESNSQTNPDDAFTTNAQNIFKTGTGTRIGGTYLPDYKIGDLS